MFKITNKSGFHITLENGWTVSVQFGPANYCDNYYRGVGRENDACGEKGSLTAECAVWGPDNKLYEYKGFNGDTVGGFMKPRHVLELLNWAASQKRE